MLRRRIERLEEELGVQVGAAEAVERRAHLATLPEGELRSVLDGPILGDDPISDALRSLSPEGFAFLKRTRS